MKREEDIRVGFDAFYVPPVLFRADVCLNIIRSALPCGSEYLKHAQRFGTQRLVHLHTNQTS